MLSRWNRESEISKRDSRRLRFALVCVAVCSFGTLASCGGFEPEYRAGPGSAGTSANTSADGSCVKKEGLAPGGSVQNLPSGAAGANTNTNTNQAGNATSTAPAATVSSSTIQSANNANAKVFALMGTYKCTGCHSTVLPIIKTEEDTVNNAKSIKESIKAGRMPKSGYTPVSAADKKTIAEWVPATGAALRLAVGDTYNGAVKKIIVDNCLSCHNVGGKEPVLATYSLVKKNYDVSMAAIAKGSMPPSGALKQADVSSLKDWAAGGFQLGEGTGGTTTAQQAVQSATGAADCK